MKVVKRWNSEFMIKESVPRNVFKVHPLLCFQLGIATSTITQ